MSQPIVSYVVASYNHESFIGKLLESISKQTFTELEIIVVDDGSTDGTLQVAQRWAKLDSRIVVHSQENRGVVVARNFGVERSRGRYVSVVDSDDLLPLDRTEKMVRAFDANPAVPLVYGDAEIINLSLGKACRFFQIYKPIDGPFSDSLFCHYCFVPAGSVMFRRDIWDRTGKFWGPAPHTDYLKWIEIGMHGEPLRLSQEVLGTWVLHGKNLSQGDAVERCHQYDSLHQGFVQLADKYPEFANRIGHSKQNRRYGRCYFMGGFYAGRESNWRLAQQQFGIALCYDKSLINYMAWVSALPFINQFSRIAYGLATRIFLRGIV